MGNVVATILTFVGFRKSEDFLAPVANVNNYVKLSVRNSCSRVIHLV